MLRYVETTEENQARVIPDAPLSDGGRATEEVKLAPGEANRHVVNARRIYGRKRSGTRQGWLLDRGLQIEAALRLLGVPLCVTP